MSVRFGILGAASIAQKFCQSVKDAPNAEVFAIASRSLDRARAFAEEHCPDAKVYGTYEELLQDPEVDAVYLPMPTSMRTEWALQAVSSGKHILSEKPLAPCAQDAQRVVDACSAAGKLYMDDTMFMHHARTSAMLAALEDTESFGTPSLVGSCFSVNIPEEALRQNIRASQSCEPLGALGDLGWYNIRFSLWAFKYETPEAVSCHFHELTEEGVPLALTATLRFTEGRVATFDNSFKTSLRQWAEVSSSECTLTLQDFVVPQQEEARFRLSTGSIGDKALYFPAAEISETAVECVQHTALVEKYASMVLSGEHDDFWSRVALQTQLVVDACMRSGQQDGVWVQLQDKA